MGDFVLINYNPSGDSQIIRTLTRKTFFQPCKSVGEAFVDVKQLLGWCRFNDCKHQTEPGCAIKETIANGELSKML